MPNKPCPSREELTGYTLGTLPPQQAEAVTVHLVQCPNCEDTVQSLGSVSDPLVNQIKGLPASQPFIDEPACRKVVQSVRRQGPEKDGTLSAADHSRPAASEQARTMNRTEFVEFLTTTGFVAAGELTSLEKQLPPAEATDVQALARVLVQQGKLTKYQAAAVYQGKGKSLVYGDNLVLDRIGAGGMGQVFKAKHRRMDRIVALKVMSAAAMKNADSVKRFEREVRAAAKLAHPNIVNAHDAGVQDGVHYLVMEFVDGPDLSSLLKKQGKLPVKQACDFIAQAARGFAFAHSKGIVHRDIKPGNLLVDGEGTVKILDMGLARFDDGGVGGVMTEAELTQSGAVMGTVDYMAPEQAMNTRHADAKSDVYGLGCTLYRLVTGEPVYGGQTMVEKIFAHKEKPIPSLRQHRPDAPPALEALVTRMLAKEPAQRPTMQEVADQLANIETAPIVQTARPPMAASVPPTAVAARPSAQSHPRQIVPPKRRNRVPLLAAAGAGAILLAFGIWVTIKDKDGNEVAKVRVPDGGGVEIKPSEPGASATGGPTSAVKSQGSASPTQAAATFALPTTTLSATGATVGSLPRTPVIANATVAPAPTAVAIPQTPGGVLTLTLGRDVPIRFRYIPAGSFVMGASPDETGYRIGEQQHPVSISRPFLLAETEFTNVQWLAAESGMARAEAPAADLPRNHVSWEAAVDLIQQMNQSPLGQSYRFRLPTEAEWEYACRAGTTTAFYFGKDAGKLAQYAWFKDNSENDVHPVAQLQPNAWGLYDMIGNVDEMCFDFYADDYGANGAQVDPHGPASGDKHVRRGGSFMSTIAGSRSGGHRIQDKGAWKKFGFRLACEPVGGFPAQAVVASTATSSPVAPASASNLPTTPTPPASANFYLHPAVFQRSQIIGRVDSLRYDGSTPLTIETWMMPMPTPDLPAVLATPNANGVKRADIRLFGFAPNADGTTRLTLNWQAENDGNDHWVSSSKQMVNGQLKAIAEKIAPAARNVPIHGAMVLGPKGADSAQKLDVYLNGKLVRTETAVFAHDGTLPFFLGGFADEIRVSKVARYAADFIPARRFEPDVDTIALYHCDEGSGDILVDSGGNGHNGKLTNAKWSPVPGSPTITPAPPTQPATVGYAFPNVTTLPQTPGAVLTFTLGQDVPMRFRYIPAGSFSMGSPPTEVGRGDDEQQHPVTLTRPFFLGETEVTNAQWQAAGTDKKHDDIKDGDRPHVNIRWIWAMEFAEKLNQSPLGQNYRFRLPTEAEWEYACRAGTTTSRHFGDDPKLLPEYAWCQLNTGRELHAGGQLKPNAWGLYDMYGNVSEWCFDFYDAGYYAKGPNTDPQGPEAGERHVMRGTAFSGPVNNVRSAFRVAGDIGGWVSYGFRLVCEPVGGFSVTAASKTLSPSSATARPTPVAARHPVPETQDRQPALATVKDVFKDEYAAAKSPEQKALLAKKLVDQAKQTINDPAARYVLLNEARTLAIDGVKADVLRDALLLLTREYEVEEASTFVDAWTEMLKRPKVDPTTIKVLFDESSGLFDEAVANARFDDAKRYGEFALSTSRRLPNAAAITKSTTERNAALTARQKEWEGITAAAEKLATTPEDAEANTVVGRYRALVGGDWAGAFTMLAKGSDETLKSLAAKSLAVPKGDAAALSAAGDAWWDAAQSAKAQQRTELLAGAHYWYTLANAALSGLAKARVEKRLVDTNAVIPAKKIPATNLPAILAASSTSQTTSDALNQGVVPTRGFGDAKPAVPTTPVASTVTPPKSTATSQSAGVVSPRAIAERIIAMRGVVRIVEPNLPEKLIKTIAELPAGEYEIVEVSCNYANEIRDADLQAFGSLKKLQRLHLQNSQVTGQGAVFLAGLTELVHLEINRAPIDDAGMSVITKLKNLKELDVSFSQVTDAGAMYLTNLPGLEDLNIGTTRVTDNLQFVIGKLTNLKSVNLIDTAIGDMTVRALANLPQLASVRLRTTRITDACVADLARMKNCKDIDLQNSPISAPARAALKAQMPAGVVRY